MLSHHNITTPFSVKNILNLSQQHHQHQHQQRGGVVEGETSCASMEYHNNISYLPPPHTTYSMAAAHMDTQVPPGLASLSDQQHLNPACEYGSARGVHLEPPPQPPPSYTGLGVAQVTSYTDLSLPVSPTPTSSSGSCAAPGPTVVAAEEIPIEKSKCLQALS